MGGLQKTVIQNILRYNPKRAYFGRLTGAELNDAYSMFKHTHDWDKPVVCSDVRVGNIDGSVICNSLWNEMSYNPVRFGNVSPFLHNGVQNIYHFCRNGAPEHFPEQKIIEKIHYTMIEYMTLNGRKNGQWYDKIDTHDQGNVTIVFVDGHSDDNYKALSKLREMIRIITSQNIQDFKHAKYRSGMLKLINERHPNGIRDDKPVVKASTQIEAPMKIMNEDTEEDRLDKAMESAQITLDCRPYVPISQYEQAEQDIENIVNRLVHVR